MGGNEIAKIKTEIAKIIDLLMNISDDARDLLVDFFYFVAYDESSSTSKFRSDRVYVSARLTSHFYYSTVRTLCWSSTYNDADDNVMMPATGDRQIVRHSEERGKKLWSNTKQLEPNKEDTILIFIDSYLPHWMEIKVGEWAVSEEKKSVNWEISSSSFRHYVGY